MIEIDAATRAQLLSFVDQIVPGETESVWLTGSRARGEARPDSDWDVVAFTYSAPRATSDLFTSGQISTYTVGGGVIELVIAHPAHWNDARPYPSSWRAYGIQLRGRHDRGV